MFEEGSYLGRCLPLARVVSTLIGACDGSHISGLGLVKLHTPISMLKEMIISYEKENPAIADIRLAKLPASSSRYLPQSNS